MARVVVADDDEDVRTAIALVVRRAGHVVVEVGDGVQALAEVRADRPDLVITDGAMPVMTGFELCERLAGDPATCGIPVLMVSGSIDPDVVAQQLPHLAAAMRKPFRNDELRHRVQTLLDGS